MYKGFIIYFLLMNAFMADKNRSLFFHALDRNKFYLLSLAYSYNLCYACIGDLIIFRKRGNKIEKGGNEQKK